MDDGSRVEQSLDYLWFYTNIFTCRDEPQASFFHQLAPLVHAKECPNRDFQKPSAPLLMNQQQKYQNVDNLSPRCHKFGGIEEVVAIEPPSRETKKRERRKRRTWNKLGTSTVVHGGLHYLGFDKLKDESWAYHYQMLNNQRQTKMLPFDDDVAMKQHLKSWAYAVACTLRSSILEGES